MSAPRFTLPTQTTLLLLSLLLSACSDSERATITQTITTTNNATATTNPSIGSVSDDALAPAAITASGTPLQPLQANNLPAPSAGDRRGTSLASNGPGHVLIAGSPGRDANELTDSGAINVMFLVDGQWWFDRELVAEQPQTSAGFGQAVALSDDGRLIAASAPGDNLAAQGGGAVYLFERFGEGWVGTTTLVSPAPASFAQFGHDILIHPDGSTVFVSEHAVQGKIQVFTRAEDQWLVTQTLQAPVDESGLASQQADRFGTALAITQDGSLVVGAPGRLGLDNATGNITSGAVYTFKNIDNEWRPDQSLAAAASDWLDFGASLAVAGNGSLLLVGVIDYPITDMPLHDKAQLQVQLYGPDADQQWVWQQSLKPTGTHSEVSTVSLAASTSGERIYMALSNPERKDNTLMQYEWIEGNWFRTDLLHNQTAQKDALGYAMALLPDESGVIVSAPATTDAEQTHAGTIYTW